MLQKILTSVQMEAENATGELGFVFWISRPVKAASLTVISRISQAVYDIYTAEI